MIPPDEEDYEDAMNYDEYWEALKEEYGMSIFNINEDEQNKLTKRTKWEKYDATQCTTDLQRLYLNNVRQWERDFNEKTGKEVAALGICPECRRNPAEIKGLCIGCNSEKSLMKETIRFD